MIELDANPAAALAVVFIIPARCCGLGAPIVAVALCLRAALSSTAEARQSNPEVDRSVPTAHDDSVDARYLYLGFWGRDGVRLR